MRHYVKQYLSNVLKMFISEENSEFIYINKSKKGNKNRIIMSVTVKE